MTTWTNGNDGPGEPGAASDGGAVWTSPAGGAAVLGNDPAPGAGARRRRGKRALSAVALCGCLVAGTVVYGVARGGSVKAGASTGAADAAAAAATTTTTPASRGRSWGGPGGHHFGGPGGHHFDGPGGGGPGAVFGAGGKLTSITSTGIVVSPRSGSKIAFATSSSTRYVEGPVTVGRSALAVGEDVIVGPSRTGTTKGTAVATAVEILLPEISGKVVSVSGTSLVVEDGEGFWRHVVLGSATIYEQSGKSAHESALATGSYVVVSGNIASNHQTLDATAVALVPGGAQGGSGQSGGGSRYFGGPGPGFFAGGGFFGGRGPVPGSPPAAPAAPAAPQI